MARKIYEKLPKGYYKKSPKDFIKAISGYSNEAKKHYLKIYRINKASARSTDRGKNKLTEVQKGVVLSLAAKMYRPSEIYRIIVEEWKIKYSLNSLTVFLRKNKEMIYQKRNNYINSIDNIRLAHEKPRIEELSDIYKRSRETGNDFLAMKVLGEIRQETKGNQIFLDGNINAEVNINVKQNIMQTVEFKDMANLALIRILRNHGIDFNRIAHRLTKVQAIDPVTNKPIPGKLIPMALKDVSILTEEESKKKMAEEAKILEEKSVDKIKELLKKKMEKKKKELSEVDQIVEDIEIKNGTKL